MSAAADAAISLKGLRCPKCRYELAGLTTQVCPECGTAFDPAALASFRPRRHWLLAISLTFIVLYAPFGWLFFVHDDPSYVRHWVLLWPVLPGLVPTFLIFSSFNYAPGHIPDWASITIFGVITLAALVLTAWLASRSRLCLIITLFIMLILSIINSLLAHVIFAA